MKYRVTFHDPEIRAPRVYGDGPTLRLAKLEAMAALKSYLENNQRWRNFKTSDFLESYEIL